MALTRKTTDSILSLAKKDFMGAALIPFVYVVLATAYIFLSGRIAEMVARDTRQLAFIETVKGFSFVLVTGILLFILCLLWLQRLKRQTMLLVQSERMAMAGMASASIAHDLNNMLMLLSGLLEELKDHEKENEFLKTIRKSLEISIKELTQFSGSLVRAAKQLEPEGQQDIELSARLTLLAKLLSKHPDVRLCLLRVHALPSATIRLNGPLFEQAVLNLVINAAQAVGPGGEIELSVHQGNGFWVLQVEDNGPGIMPADFESIFSPGYTTKKNGSGLGLLSVKAFADSCGGIVSVKRSRLGGAAFLVQIPIDPIKRDQRSHGISRHPVDHSAAGTEDHGR